MNILLVSSRVFNYKASLPLMNILKKNIISYSIKNSMKIQNTFVPLKNSYITKSFFSSSKDEKKDQTEEKSEKETVDEEKKTENKEDASNVTLNEKYKELKTLYNEQEIKLEKRKKKFHEIKNLYIKNIDEIDAIKLRSDREIKNSKEYAITKFAKDLLDVHDNFTRALGVISDKDFKTLSEEEKIETFDSFVEGKR